MSKWVKDTERAGRAFSMIPEAVRKLTSDSADFHRIDSGRLKPGARADPFVIDPTKFDDSIEEVLEVPMGEFSGVRRLVRGNDDTVRAVMVNGRVAWTGDGS
jgi:N-acyl-D-aspartate/D-glutamate deacylase